MNEAKAGEIPPSPPETTAWDVVGDSLSGVTVQNQRTFTACHLIDRCCLQTIIRGTRAPCKVQPENRANQLIKSECELSNRIIKRKSLDIRSRAETHVGAPEQNPRPPRTRTLGDSACQHCLAFNLASITFSHICEPQLVFNP